MADRCRRSSRCCCRSSSRCFLFPATNAGARFLHAVAVLLTPPFMAGFVAATVSKANPMRATRYGVSPFIATRPLSSAALIAAKLKMTIWSTVAAWLLVLVAIPLGLMLSGTWQIVIEQARDAIDDRRDAARHRARAARSSGLMASTWKQLVQSLYIGLTGREWIIKSERVSCAVVPGARRARLDWISGDRDVQSGAMGRRGRGSSSCWSAARCRPPSGSRYASTDSRLLSDRTLVAGAACWCLAVLALYGLLVWLVDTPLIPRHVARALRDPRNPARAIVRGAAGARMESAPMTHEHEFP